jgi:hypothetical protein
MRPHTKASRESSSLHEVPVPPRLEHYQSVPDGLRGKRWGRALDEAKEQRGPGRRS